MHPPLHCLGLSQHLFVTGLAKADELCVAIVEGLVVGLKEVVCRALQCLHWVSPHCHFTKCVEVTHRIIGIHCTKGCVLD